MEEQKPTKEHDSTEIDKPRKKLDLDTILEEEVGQFGLYQIRSLLLALLIIVFNSWIAHAYIFTTARIPTRCLISECENEGQTVFIPDWILNAIPGTSADDFDECQRYAGNPINVTIPENTCPISIFDHGNVVACESYLYENANTVVYDFGLACDEWRRTVIGTIQTCGTLIGLPLSGVISDRWGRRTSMTINAFNAAWIGLTRYFASVYAVFAFLQILEFALGCAGFLGAYILVVELVGPKYRVLAGTIMNTFFAVGQILLGLIAWKVQYWRHFILAVYGPQLISIIYFWIMSESVRWYMSIGRYDKSEEILKQAARINKKHLSEESLQALKLHAEDEKQKLLEEKQKKEIWLPIIVFQHKSILTRCIISPVWWVTTTFIYYGMSVNSVNMSGNRFLNFIVVAAVEIPGYWTSFLLISRIGRKPVLIVAYWICSGCQLAYIFISNDLYVASLIVYLIGKYSIAMVMTAVYVYTAELYPTKYRQRLFAYSSTVGRIGAILAPLTPALNTTIWENFSSLLFAGLAFLSGCLIFITPETLGCNLPDTMEEASNVGKRKSKL